MKLREILPIICDWQDYWQGELWCEGQRDRAIVRLARYLNGVVEEDEGFIWKWVDAYLETGELPEEES